MFQPPHDFLSNLPYSAGVETRQISAENPTGEKGGGCKWDPNPGDPNLYHSRAALELGRGWKVRPYIPLASGEMVILGDIDGPGCINQLFFTSDHPQWRELILRLYWDHEPIPSVETPIGDFFASGHDGARHLVNSIPVAACPSKGCNSYWQMPFRQHAKITLENRGHQAANIIAYRILYKLLEIPDTAAYFHCQWRRSRTKKEHPEHVIVDGIRGSGLYVGTYLAWTTQFNGWWGEGEVKFYIDGDKEFPSMADNGTEDYFGGAWCFAGEDGLEEPFSGPFLGLPLADHQNKLRKYSLYRWHLLDSIGFKKNLKVSVQALGLRPDESYEPLTDDIASAAYWYQIEPHSPFPQLPDSKQGQ